MVSNKTGYQKRIKLNINRLINPKSSLPFFVFLCFSVVILLHSNLSFWGGNNFSRGDQAVYVNTAYQIVNGNILYKDIFSHKGPIFHFINSIGFLIGGPSGIWLIEIIFMTFGSFIGYKLLSTLWGKRASFLGIMVSMCLFIICYTMQYFTGLTPEEYSVFFTFISLLIFYFIILKNKYHLLYFLSLGTVLSAIFFMKPNLIGTVFAGLLLIWFNLIKNKRYAELIRTLYGLLLGFLIVFIPLMIYFYYHNSIQSLYLDYWAFNLIYSKSSLKTYLLTGMSSLFSLKPIGGHIVVPLLLISYLHHVYKKQRGHKNWQIKEYFILLGIVSFVINISLISLSSANLNYYQIILIPSIGILFTYFYSYLQKIPFIKNTRFMCLIILISFIYAPVYTQLKRIYLFHLSPVKTEYKYHGQELIEYINDNTDQDDYIYILDHVPPSVYYLTGRRSPTKFYFSWVVPFNESFMQIDEQKQEYVNNIINKAPKLIISTYNILSENGIGNYFTSRAIKKNALNKRLFNYIKNNYTDSDYNSLGDFFIFERK